MRIAYHPTGAAVTAYALAQWLDAARLDIAAAPGTVATLADPKHPYAFGSEILADDRETQGGKRYSRIRAVRRRATLEFPSISMADDAAWQAWHLATQGGRVPFVWEEPTTRELIAVTCTVTGLVSRIEQYQRSQPVSLELVEWL